METTQMTMGFSVKGSIFAIAPGATVECFSSKEVGIVVKIYEQHCNGKHACLVVNLRDGREMIPFAEDCKVIKPSRGGKHEISQDTAERFAEWNRRGNGR